MSIVRNRKRDDPLDAFEAFVRADFTDVWRFVRRRVDSTADADDVTAEVFATAWRRRDEAPPAEERRLWVFGVARLTLRNHHRSGVRRDRLHLRLVDGTATTTEPVERDDTVWRALASLDPDDRDLLIMRAWDGLAVNDIAVVLGVSANAVSQRLAKARTRLAAAMAAVDPGDPAGEPTVVATVRSAPVAVAPSASGRHESGAADEVTDPETTSVATGSTLGRTDMAHDDHTDHGGTGHAPVDPATAAGSEPETAPRLTEENGHA